MKTKPEAAFDLLAELGGPVRSLEIVSTPGLGAGPFRESHLELLLPWLGYGFDEDGSKALQDALKKELRGGANPNAGLREVENSGVSGTPLDGNRGAPPPELRDPLRRLNKTDQ